MGAVGQQTGGWSVGGELGPVGIGPVEFVIVSVVAGSVVEAQVCEVVEALEDGESDVESVDGVGDCVGVSGGVCGGVGSADV